MKCICQKSILHVTHTYTHIHTFLVVKVDVLLSYLAIDVPFIGIHLQPLDLLTSTDTDSDH